MTDSDLDEVNGGFYGILLCPQCGQHTLVTFSFGVCNSCGQCGYDGWFIGY